MINLTSPSSDPPKKSVNFEEALQECGGFGKFQYGVTALLVFAFMTGGWIVYALPFLTKFPDYECLDQGSQTWQSCKRTTICDDNLPSDQWRIDYTSPDSFKNWVDPDKLNLTCVSEGLIGSLGSMYFIGFAISSGITPLLAGKYGRKLPYLGSLLLQTLAYLVIILSKSIYFAKI